MQTKGDVGALDRLTEIADRLLYGRQCGEWNLFLSLPNHWTSPTPGIYAL